MKVFAYIKEHWIWFVVGLVVLALSIGIFLFVKHKNKTVSDYPYNLSYSSDLVSHIEQAEGNELNAYRDLNGYLTIGYGHNLDTNGTTFSDGTPIGNSISQDQADQLLRQDLDSLQSQMQNIAGLAGQQFTQGQWDALMDFAWGGIGTFEGSTLFKYVTGEKPVVDDTTIPNEFKKWVYAGSPLVVQPGLVTRRQWEADRWTGNY